MACAGGELLIGDEEDGGCGEVSEGFEGERKAHGACIRAEEEGCGGLVDLGRCHKKHLREGFLVKKAPGVAGAFRNEGGAGGALLRARWDAGASLEGCCGGALLAAPGNTGAAKEQGVTVVLRARGKRARLRKGYCYVAMFDAP